jgi:Pyruvate/2-oxoacid:ferredoxin oxidoreductase delta subunit
MINPDACKNCDQCGVFENCPMKAAFRESKTDKPWVDFYRCSGCMKCKDFCPFKAVVEITHPCDGKGRMGW